MRMNFNVTGIYHEPFVVWRVNQLFQQTFPNPFISPTAKTTVCILPVAVCGGQVPPGRTCPQNPENTIDKSAVVFGYTAPSTCPAWQTRFQYRPRLVRYVMPLVFKAHFK